MCIPCFKLFDLTVPEKKVKKINVWKLEIKKNKGTNKSSSLISVYTIHLSTVHGCTKFQPSRPHSSWEKFDKKFSVWKLKRKKNEEIKGWICRSSLILVYTIRLPLHLPLFMCVPSFSLLGLTAPEKSVTKNFNVWKLERKKSKEIKGQISRSSLISVYTIHLPIVHVCTKFQSSRPYSSWEKCGEKFNVWKLERKTNEEINGQISRSSLIPVYTIHLPTDHVCTKFQSSRPHSSWKKYDENFHLKGYGMTESQNDGRTRQIQYSPHFFKGVYN